MTECGNLYLLRQRVSNCNLLAVLLNHNCTAGQSFNSTDFRAVNYSQANKTGALNIKG